MEPDGMNLQGSNNVFLHNPHGFQVPSHFSSRALCGYTITNVPKAHAHELLLHVGGAKTF